MSTTYAQRQTTAQKKDASSASSVLDNSSQSESLQRKADMANNAAQRVETPRPNNTGMPDNLKSGIESLSGFSMDDVRVHYNSSKPATVQALAYTQGTDIHVAPGQEKHLPHEAWHIAQQMAGRVSPTTNINGMPVNDNAGLEHEADVMGEKAVQCKMFGINFTKGKVQNTAVQRMAYAKTNEDGTVSAETEQYEGDDATAKIFGWNVDEKNAKNRKRPDNVARKVDQYKKEMLTYIANCIQEQGKKNNRDYGPHISVVITRSIWYIAVNTDCIKDGYVDYLRDDANDVKKQIMEKWNVLSTTPDFIDGLKADDPEKVDDNHAKKQALYIVYRWAGKDNGVVVEQNQIREEDKGEGVIHGEMATIKLLQKKSYMLNQAKMLFEKAEGMIGLTGNVFENAVDAETAEEAAKKAAAAKEAAKEAAEKAAAAEAAKEAAEKAAAAEEAAVGAADKAAAAEEAAVGAADKADTAVNAIVVAGVAKTSPNGNFENAQKYVKKACCAVKDCLRNNAEHHRVVRVGGTKTPCFDCAYEMHVRNVSESEDESNIYSGIQAEYIGERKVVTMTPNYGCAYAHWLLNHCLRKDQERPKEEEHPHYNSDQDMDYNELYATFNDLNMESKMDVTTSMLELWEYRRKTFEKDRVKGSMNFDVKKLEKKIKGLGNKKAMLLKNLIVESLNNDYVYVEKDEEKTEQLDEKKLNGRLLSDEEINVIEEVFEPLEQFNLPDKDKRCIVNMLDVKIQSYLAAELLGDYDQEKKVSKGNLYYILSLLEELYNKILKIRDLEPLKDVKELKSDCSVCFESVKNACDVIIDEGILKKFIQNVTIDPDKKMSREEYDSLLVNIEMCIFGLKNKIADIDMPNEKLELIKSMLELQTEMNNSENGKKAAATPKAAAKPKEATPKAAAKSKEATPKAAAKSKEATPKAAATPQKAIITADVAYENAVKNLKILDMKNLTDFAKVCLNLSDAAETFLKNADIKNFTDFAMVCLDSSATAKDYGKAAAHQNVEDAVAKVSFYLRTAAETYLNAADYQNVAAADAHQNAAAADARQKDAADAANLKKIKEAYKKAAHYYEAAAKNYVNAAQKPAMAKAMVRDAGLNKEAAKAMQYAAIAYQKHQILDAQMYENAANAYQKTINFYQNPNFPDEAAEAMQNAAAAYMEGNAYKAQFFEFCANPGTSNPSQINPDKYETTMREFEEQKKQQEQYFAENVDLLRTSRYAALAKCMSTL